MTDREIQRKMAMATESPVEIHLIYSIPIHLAVRLGLHLNYQLHSPNILPPMGELLWKIFSCGNANDKSKCLGEHEM